MTLALASRRAAARTPRPGLLARVGRAAATWRQRRQLAALDAHLLNDLGISAAEAQREAARPFWDLPGEAGPRF